MAFIHRRQGRWEEAVDLLEDLREVDPYNYKVAFNLLISYIALREYERAESEMQRAISIAPEVPDAYFEGAWNYLAWDGVTERARFLLNSVSGVESPYLEYTMIILDLFDRTPESALDRVRRVKDEAFTFDYWYIPRALVECMCFVEMNQTSQAEVSCRSALEVLDTEIKQRPHDFRLFVAAGHAHAILGRKLEAMRAGEHALDLMPISKDVLAGTQVAIELSKIYSRVGETRNALDLIEGVLSMPSDLSVGLLRLDPVWDPLRDDPRFQALLEKYDTEAN
jgi:serine/threonine-protein kinase